jgi:hypothetical protein
MSDNVDNKLNSYVGYHVTMGGEDYVRIMELIRVTKNDQEYKVFVFSSGKRAEANSVINYIRKNVQFPDGTDYVMRNRVKYAKAKGKGSSPAFGSSIRNVAKFADSKGK